MFTLKEIRSGAQAMVLVFKEDIDGEHAKEHVYENIHAIEFPTHNMIQFKDEAQEYLFDGSKIIQAEKIFVHRLHPQTYSVKNGDAFTLFYNTKKVFKLKRKDIKWLAPSSEKTVLVAIGNTFELYNEGKKVDKFSAFGYQEQFGHEPMRDIFHENFGQYKE